VNFLPPINERIYVALDVPTAIEATQLAGRLASLGVGFKVGPHYVLDELFSAFITGLCSLNNGRFYDLKHLEIPETVKASVSKAAQRQFHFATIHPEENLVRAAVKAVKGTSLNLLIVTHLTSLPPNLDLVIEHTYQAVAWGCQGVVCSVPDVPYVRGIVPDDFLVVSPGVRPLGYDTNDHERVGTPKQAIDDGANFIVVGRPVILAQDPVGAVCRIIDEIK